MRKRYVVFSALMAMTSALSAQDSRSPKKAPTLVVLATGGTIAGVAQSATQTSGYKAASVSADQLVDAVPGLKAIANIRAEQTAQIASQHMNNEVWLKLAKRVNEVLKDPKVDGVLITHGTDTLEETSYFLHLTVKSNKPVVLVGAMRPATAISADGPMNLYEGALVATSKEAAGKGVLVVMNDQIVSARDVTKASSYALDAFRPLEHGFLGVVHDGKVRFYHQPIRRHTTRSEFDVSKLNALPRVDIVYGYANASSAPVQALVSSGSQGLVNTGVGNGSIYKDVEPALVEARTKGVFIVRSSHTVSGPVERNGEVDDDKLDFVSADNLNPQKARVLLMLGLTKTKSTKDLQRMFDEY